MTKEIRYLGKIGSYSHVCALNYQSDHQLHDYQLVSYSTITDILTKNSNNIDSILILPLENSTSGDVYETYHQIYKHGLDLIATYTLKIEHCLFALKESSIDLLMSVYSHPQALLQVNTYLQKNHLTGIPDFSTADALLKVATSSDLKIGAVAAKDLLNYYDNLKIIDCNISNHSNNHTRFLITRYKPTKERYQVNINNLDENANFFLLFTLENDKAGLLTTVLNIISRYNINLSSIKSRPIEGKSFEYFFIIEGNINNKNDDNYHLKLIKALKQQTSSFTYNIY